MQIYTWYHFFPNLAQFAFKQFVIPDCKMHPYGSWKDIKCFCNYIESTEKLFKGYRALKGWLFVREGLKDFCHRRQYKNV